MHRTVGPHAAPCKYCFQRRCNKWHFAASYSAVPCRGERAKFPPLYRDNVENFFEAVVFAPPFTTVPAGHNLPILGLRRASPQDRWAGAGQGSKYGAAMDKKVFNTTTADCLKQGLKQAVLVLTAPISVKRNTCFLALYCGFFEVPKLILAVWQHLLF